MPASPELRSDESMPLQLQLAHIAGDVKLILFQIGDISQQVERHEGRIGGLESSSQSLRDAFKDGAEKAEALALALKEAKEAVEATALQESNKAQAAAREKSDRDALGWSPVTKVFAVGAAVAVAVNVYQALHPGA